MTDKHLYREIVQTADGSNTLYIPDLDEHYHSKFGAIQESKHIFIEAGLKYFLQNFIPPKEKISVFEVGLGTGLNALLTAIELESLKVNVHYTALEAYPLNSEEINSLNYTESLPPLAQTIFQQIHQAEWNQGVQVRPHFYLEKRKGFLQEWNTDMKFDLVYFDAFAPEVQPDLWTQTIFEKLFSKMNQNGVLVTYCVKGDVKRALKSSGWKIEKLPGPPGKREIIRAYL